MTEKGISLHYVRGMHFVDKLLKEAVEGGYDQKKDVNFFESYALRCRDNPLFLFDLNNFVLSSGVVLMGLNKESIEKSGNNKGYNYSMKYNLDFPAPFFKKMYEDFRTANTIETPYVDWLSITSVSPNVAINNNYLFNVRNSFMHSEYDLELADGDKYNYLMVNLHNSNYTGFEGQVYMPFYTEFMKQYYSNDMFFGLVSNLFGLQAPTNKAKDEDDLDRYLNELELYKLSYENDEHSKELIEKKLASKKMRVSNKNINKERINLTEEEINSIKLMINKYYGDKFYGFNHKIQGRLMIQMIKYLKDCKTVFSEWIMHFYDEARLAMRMCTSNDDFISIFATEPSLLMIKSYLILYRLQKKNFEDIDYDLMDAINYEFDASEPYYNDFKTRLINRGINVSEDEYRKRYFCEIYRNSLAHGNVKMEIKKDSDGEIRQYFVFEDIYGTRNRTVCISQEELKRFTSFEAFSRGQAKLKTDTSRTTSRR